MTALIYLIPIALFLGSPDLPRFYGRCVPVSSKIWTARLNVFCLTTTKTIRTPRRFLSIAFFLASLSS